PRFTVKPWPGPPLTSNGNAGFSSAVVGAGSAGAGGDGTSGGAGASSRGVDASSSTSLSLDGAGETSSSGASGRSGDAGVWARAVAAGPAKAITSAEERGQQRRVRPTKRKGDGIGAAEQRSYRLRRWKSRDFQGGPRRSPRGISRDSWHVLAETPRGVVSARGRAGARQGRDDAGHVSWGRSPRPRMRSGARTSVSHGAALPL